MRIASLLPAATDWVRAFGAGDELVGCTHACDVGGRQLPVLTEPTFEGQGDSAEIDAAVQDSLTRGLSLYRVDIEALRAAAPDVIFTQAQCEVCAVALPELEEMVASWTGQHPRLISLEPGTLKEVLAAALRIGRAIGRTQEAMAYVAEGERRLHALHEHLGIHPKKASQAWPSVVCIEWLEPLMTPGHWTPDLIEQAGGRLLLSQRDAPSRSVTWEAIRAADPDNLIVMPCGFDLDQTLRDRHYLTKREGWSELSAVRHGRVFLVDGNRYFNRPGPQVYRTIELVAWCLYGEPVSDLGVTPAASEIRVWDQVKEETA